MSLTGAEEAADWSGCGEATGCSGSVGLGPADRLLRPEERTRTPCEDRHCDTTHKPQNQLFTLQQTFKDGRTSLRPVYTSALNVHLPDAHTPKNVTPCRADADQREQTG